MFCYYPDKCRVHSHLYLVDNGKVGESGDESLSAGHPASDLLCWPHTHGFWLQVNPMMLMVEDLVVVMSMNVRSAELDLCCTWSSSGTCVPHWPMSKRCLNLDAHHSRRLLHLLRNCEWNWTLSNLHEHPYFRCYGGWKVINEADEAGWAQDSALKISCSVVLGLG